MRRVQYLAVVDASQTLVGSGQNPKNLRTAAKAVKSHPIITTLYGPNRKNGGRFTGVNRDIICVGHPSPEPVN